MGNSSARAVLLEFGSYACGYCAEFHREAWPVIREEYVNTSKVRFLYREFVFSGDSILTGLASIVYCAGHLGDYWEAHDWMFRQTSQFESLTEVRWQLSSELGLDDDEVRTCVSSDPSGPRFQILVASEAAESLGVRVVPTFIVGVAKPDGKVVGWPLVGYVPLDTLRTYIEAALKAEEG
jgi:protein-disulfide isomerase